MKKTNIRAGRNATNKTPASQAASPSAKQRSARPPLNYSLCLFGDSSQQPIARVDLTMADWEALQASTEMEPSALVQRLADAFTAAQLPSPATRSRHPLDQRMEMIALANILSTNETHFTLSPDTVAELLKKFGFRFTAGECEERLNELEGHGFAQKTELGWSVTMNGRAWLARVNSETPLFPMTVIDELINAVDQARSLFALCGNVMLNRKGEDLFTERAAVGLPQLGDETFSRLDRSVQAVRAARKDLQVANTLAHG